MAPVLYVGRFNTPPELSKDGVTYFTDYAEFCRAKKLTSGEIVHIGESESREERFDRLDPSARLLYEDSLNELSRFYVNHPSLPNFTPELIERSVGHLILRLARKVTHLVDSMGYSLQQVANSKAQLEFGPTEFQTPRITLEALSTLQSIGFGNFVLRSTFDKRFRTENSLAIGKFTLGPLKRFPTLVYQTLTRALQSFSGTAVAVKGSYLTRFEQAKLEVATGSLPRFRELESAFFELSPEDVEEDFALRRELVDWLSARFSNSHSEEIFAHTLTQVVPYVYLGGWSKLADVAKRYYRSPKSFFTANSYAADDIFKAATCLWYEASTLNVMQHGNLVGTHRHFNHTVEERIADNYLTWGWCGERQEKSVTPLGIQKDTRQWESPKGHPDKTLLILRGSSPNWWEWDTVREHEKYLEFISEFILSVKSDTRKELQIRSYGARNAFHQSDSEILQSLVGFPINFAPKRASLRELLSSARLVIHGYDSTGILESISRSRMFIALIPEYPGLVEEQYVAVYERMIDVGLFFSDPTLAARKVSQSHGELLEWWFSSSVQDALSDFRGLFANEIQAPIAKTLSNYID